MLRLRLALGCFSVRALPLIFAASLFGTAHTNAAAADLTFDVRAPNVNLPRLSNGDDAELPAGRFRLRIVASLPIARVRLNATGQQCNAGNFVDVNNGDDPATAADDGDHRRRRAVGFTVFLTAGEVCTFTATAWYENYRWAGSASVTLTGVEPDDGTGTPDEPPTTPPPESPARYDITTGTERSTPMDTSSPPVAQSNHGTRLYCTTSHFSYDDPVVHPGQPGAAHLHLFWGNTSADAYSTADTLASGGRASCEGGRNNQSAYWAPALFDASGQATLPETIFVYYKSFGNESTFDRESIRPIPDGLEMLANRSVPNVYVPGAFSVSPDGQGLRVRVRFPNCLQTDVNGNPVLQSPNNVSHLSYEAPASGNPNLCPDSHPYRIPQVSYLISYDVPYNSDWRLASDGNGPQGASLHADYFASWTRRR